MKCAYLIPLLSVIGIIAAMPHRVSAQTRPIVNTAIGPIYPAIQQTYELEMVEHVTLTGQDARTLDQEVTNVFEVHIDKIDAPREVQALLVTGSICWRRQSINTVVSGVKADPQVHSWNDANHQSTFSVVYASPAAIDKAELKSQMPELRGGLLAFLSATVFPKSTVAANGSIDIPNPFTRQIGDKRMPNDAVTLLPGTKGVFESKSEQAHAQTRVRLVLSNLADGAVLHSLEARQDVEMGDARAQKLIKVRVLKESSNGVGGRR